jgi:hypothetical protein
MWRRGKRRASGVVAKHVIVDSRPEKANWPSMRIGGRKNLL